MILREFKEFAMKGNVLDMAVGIIIGAAFGKVVTSLVADVLMPPLGLLVGKMDFSNLFINLSGKEAASLAAAKEAGLATVNYGLFLNTLVDFIVVSFAVFLLITQVNRLRRRQTPAEAPASSTKDCPFCMTPIPLKAVRCPNCTSSLSS